MKLSFSLESRQNNIITCFYRIYTFKLGKINNNIRLIDKN